MQSKNKNNPTFFGRHEILGDRNIKQKKVREHHQDKQNRKKAHDGHHFLDWHERRDARKHRGGRSAFPWQEGWRPSHECWHEAHPGCPGQRVRLKLNLHRKLHRHEDQETHRLAQGQLHLLHSWLLLIHHFLRIGRCRRHRIQKMKIVLVQYL